MKDAANYLAHIKALIVANRQVIHWTVAREEAQGDMGLFRYRLILRDGGLLEMFERFRVVEERVAVAKYSFHWQDAAGQLRKRWDNAAHHPEVPTHPHHVHDGTETDVLPHAPISAEEVLAIIAAEAASCRCVFLLLALTAVLGAGAWLAPRALSLYHQERGGHLLAQTLVTEGREMTSTAWPLLSGPLTDAEARTLAEQAVVRFRTALAAAPSNAQAQRWLGRASLLLDEPGEAAAEGG